MSRRVSGAGPISKIRAAASPGEQARRKGGKSVVGRMHSVFKLSQYVDITKWEEK